MRGSLLMYARSAYFRVRCVVERMTVGSGPTHMCAEKGCVMHVWVCTNSASRRLYVYNTSELAMHEMQRQSTLTCDFSARRSA